jgi:hypothetical protein
MTQENAAGSTIPAPTGPYPVGRTNYHWRDTAHGVATTESRELVAWIWYPAAPEPEAETAPYLPAGWEPVAQFLGFHAEAARSHAVEDAQLAAERASYPVLLFSPAGFPPVVLAATLEEVASHGYIVVGVNHTRESAITVFPDGRVVPMDMELMQPVLGPFTGGHNETFRARAAIADAKTADLRFVLDQLKRLNAGRDRFAGRLDLTRLGAFGHSLGGNAALELCRLDARCRAAANLDGAIWNAVGTVGVDRPVLQFMADHRELRAPCDEQVRAGVYPSAEWCAAERALMLHGWQTVFERARPGYGVTIAGTGHASFMDLPFLSAEPASRAAGGMAAVSIDSRRAWRIVCDYLLAFFARHLSGEGAPLLDGQSPSYPEVTAGPPADLFPKPAIAGTAADAPMSVRPT